MRNTASRLFDEEDYTSNPRSIHKNLAAEMISKGSPALCSDLHSLHLKSLVEDYLEPSSHSSSLLQHPSYPFNHSPYCEDQTFLTNELQGILQNVGTTYGELRREVVRAIRKGDNLVSAYEQLHVLVLEHLRKLGYNAGICESQRVPHKNSNQAIFPAEEYEYMDVILQADQEKGIQARASERVIIDLRFRSQFEIARPTDAYVELLKVVPIAYVGTPRVLHKVLRVVSEAMKRSLKSQGMSLPPWRRLSFLHSKWLSPNYSRVTLAPTLINLNCTVKKPSTKRENSPYASIVNRPCVVTKSSPLVDSKHKSSSLFIGKRENSYSIINNPPSLVAKPPLHPNSKRILKNYNSTDQALTYNVTSQSNTPTKESIIQSGEPSKVPWQLPHLSNPPSSVKRSKRLVGALTMALRYGSDPSTYLSSVEV